MGKRIINIALLVLAIVAFVLLAIYVVNWNSTVDTGNSDTNKANVANYKAIGALQSFDEGQQLLDEFLTAKVDAIGSNAKPGAYYTKVNNYIEKNQAICEQEEAQAQDFFCYLNILKGLKEADFKQFKADYPNNLTSLTKDGAGKEFTFGKEYVNDFKKVNTYEDLSNYINEDLSKKYTDFKTAQLTKEGQVKSVKTLQTVTDSVFKISAFDAKAKTAALEGFQNNFKKYQSMDKKLLGPAFSIIYIFAGIGIAAIFIFMLLGLFTDFKAKSKGLIAIAGVIVVALLCYLFAAPDATNAAFAKLSISPAMGRFIEAVAYFIYVLTVVGLGLLVYDLVSSMVKSGNRK